MVREEVRPGRREGVGWRQRKRGMHKDSGSDSRLWEPGHTRWERTENMDHMFVTLDVSKLSGWLNFSAPCRGVERRACDSRRDAARKA